MSKPRFVGIGKLGGRDCDGYHHVMIKPEFRELFSALDEVYLIFESDRVFFVSITNKKISEKKLWICFAEDGVDSERSKHKEVILAIKDTKMATSEAQTSQLAGFRVLCNGEELGMIEDHFSNGAQEVLVIKDLQGCEILIPEVPHYVQEILQDSRTVVLQNADDLISFYRGEAK